MLDIKNKVRNEYIFFEQMTLGMSRQNIYNKCYEIWMKQQISDRIQNMEFDESDSQILSNVENLLEYIYLLCCEMKLDVQSIDLAITEIKRRVQTKKN